MAIWDTLGVSLGSSDSHQNNADRIFHDAIEVCKFRTEAGGSAGSAGGTAAGTG